mgnify:CR=1 FL=1
MSFNRNGLTPVIVPLIPLIFERVTISHLLDGKYLYKHSLIIGRRTTPFEIVRSRNSAARLPGPSCKQQIPREYLPGEFVQCFLDFTIYRYHFYSARDGLSPSTSTSCSKIHLAAMSPAVSSMLSTNQKLEKRMYLSTMKQKKHLHSRCFSFGISQHYRCQLSGLHLKPNYCNLNKKKCF